MGTVRLHLPSLQLMVIVVVAAIPIARTHLLEEMAPLPPIAVGTMLQDLGVTMIQPALVVQTWRE